MNRIDACFERLRREGRRALMPFLTAGDPDLATTSALVREAVRRGAHLIEIGIPYSDPIADGPVISASYTRALQGGVRLAEIFAMIRELRGSSDIAATPLVTMVSYAIVHRHGPQAYVRDAAAAGADGLIVPDLPVEEATALRGLCDSAGLKLIQLVAPTTPRERAVRIAQGTTGFLYYMSVAGITGERRELPPELVENVAWLRTQTSLPICVGFGISRPDQIARLAPVADGLIVGSALVRRLADGKDRPRAELVGDLGDFIAELAAALPTPAAGSTGP